MTAPNGAREAKAYFSAKKGPESSRKWVFRPANPLPRSHQPRDYQPTPQRLFPSMQHLVFQGVCASPCPSCAALTPLAHMSRGPVSCVAPARRGRATVFCCKTRPKSRAGRGVSQQIDRQAVMGGSSKHVIQGRNRFTWASMYVSTHITGCTVCCVCVHLCSWSSSRSHVDG